MEQYRAHQEMINMGWFSKKTKSNQTENDSKSSSTKNMVIRDKRMGLDHFLSFISIDDSRIEKITNKLNSGEVAEDRIPSIQKRVFSIQLSKLEAMYSAGYPMQEIKTLLESMLDNLEISIAKNRYREFLKLISLCVLLDVNDSKALGLVERADRDGLEDALFDFIAKYYDEARSISTEVLHKRPYEILLKTALGESEDPIKDLHTFHSRWYASHQDTGWYNSHKDKSSQSLYSGYWAFEMAAFMKILGLDESLMEGKDYYPFGF